MPQDGSSNYQYPPGTPGVPDQTIESEAYNTFLDDLVTNDLNWPRPVHRGGTGASTSDAALTNLSGEKATQVVTAYLSHFWMPGSFRSAAGATDEPVAGHSFAGICYINEPLVSPPTNQNVIVEARDQNDTVIPGRVYVRQKKAGVWDAAWVEQVGGSADLITTADARYVNLTGDTMTGLLTLSDDPTADLHSVTKRYVDGGVGGLSAGKVDRDGDTMTGLLVLSGNATLPLHAVPMQQLTGDLAYSGMQINGSMDVGQEFGAALAEGWLNWPGGGYAMDGWRIDTAQLVPGTTAFNSQRVASLLPGIPNCLKLIAAGAANFATATDLALISQLIEGLRWTRLGFGYANAQSVTVGFWIYAPVTGTVCVSLCSTGTVARIHIKEVTINAANTWEYKTLTFPPDVTGPANWLTSTLVGCALRFCFGGGTTTKSGTAGVWGNVGSNQFATTNQTNFFASNGNAVQLTGVTVLPGIHAPTAAQSPLIMRPYDQELATCQRYFHGASVAMNNVSVSTPGGKFSAHHSFPCEMRAAATVVRVAFFPSGACDSLSGAISSLGDAEFNMGFNNINTLGSVSASFTFDARL